MSSHHQWAEEICAQHDRERPFAPENGKALAFQVGDRVRYTNDYGAVFEQTITGLYAPAQTDANYATGARYLLDWDCPWVPVAESRLRLVAERSGGT